MWRHIQKFLAWVNKGIYTYLFYFSFLFKFMQCVSVSATEKHCWNWHFIITCKTSVISGTAGISDLVTLISFMEMRINHKVNKEHGELQPCFSGQKLCCFCSSVSNRDTDVMEDCHMFKPSLRICWHVPYERPVLPLIPEMVLYHSLLMVLWTPCTFLSVKPLMGWLDKTSPLYESWKWFRSIIPMALSVNAV